MLFADPTFEKQSVHSNDHSSSGDSVIKGETRTGTYTGTYTGTASELSPSDGEDDDYSNRDWESTNLDDDQGARSPSRNNSYRIVPGDDTVSDSSTW